MLYAISLERANRLFRWELHRFFAKKKKKPFIKTFKISIRGICPSVKGSSRSYSITALFTTSCMIFDYLSNVQIELSSAYGITKTLQCFANTLFVIERLGYFLLQFPSYKVCIICTSYQKLDMPVDALNISMGFVLSR